MGFRRAGQPVLKHSGHDRRTMLRIGQVAGLHAGEHQHMRVMADQSPVEGGAVKIGHEPPVRIHGKPAASRRRPEITDKGVDVRWHMLQMAGIGRHKRLEPPRRFQRPFRRRRHLVHMDVVMQQPDMVRPGTGKPTVKGGVNLRRAGGRVRRARIHIIDLPGCQHDLRIDKEGGDVGIIAEFGIDRGHFIGIGAFP